MDRIVIAAVAALAAATAWAADGESDYERCLQVVRLYPDLVSVRDSGVPRAAVRTELLKDRAAVRQVGGSQALEVLLETVYGHPELTGEDFEDAGRQECLRRVLR